MPNIDPFTTQLVAMIRQMPDEDLLELVRQHLGDAAPATSAAKPSLAAPRRAPARRPSKRRPIKTTRPTAAKHRFPEERLMDNVEECIHASDGVALEDVAVAVGESRARVASVIGSLKRAKRIFRGGKRRFARYAGSAEVAQEASAAARGEKPAGRKRAGKRVPSKVAAANRKAAATPKPAVVKPIVRRKVMASARRRTRP